LVPVPFPLIILKSRVRKRRRTWRPTNARLIQIRFSAVQNAKIPVDLSKQFAAGQNLLGVSQWEVTMFDKGRLLPSKDK
jgi:hypothetical protein